MEVNAGTVETKLTRLPYFLSFVRHIDSIHHKLNDVLAPKYFDIIEHNKIRTVDRTKTRRLQALKVCLSVSQTILVAKRYTLQQKNV